MYTMKQLELAAAAIVAAGEEITTLRARVAELEAYNAGRTDEMIAMTRQLAASQAREQQLREALKNERRSQRRIDHFKMTADALAIPSDTTALDKANKLYAAEYIEGLISKGLITDVKYLQARAAQLRKEAESR
jgi:hypothetical protein